MKATGKNLKKGFTLVELVIVIAVIAILAAVLIPTFSTVIKNANNSADQQLVSQLNLIGAMHQVDNKNNEFEFADNIRTMLEEEGIKRDSLVTKNKDAIIAYNTQTNKFERYELDDKDLVVSDSAAYYPEEIFKNKIIVSTKGNALAEAIYALHNLPSGATDDYVQKAYIKIPENLQEAVKNALEGAVIIDGGGNAVSIDFSNGEPKVVSATRGTKVIFSEEVTEFNLDEKYMFAKVIIPNNVKSVKGILGAIKFAGNTAVVEGIDAAHICTIAQARYSGWYLVTDASTLKVGDQIIIAYETNVLGASSSTDSTAYRQRVENGIKVTGNKAIILSDSVARITLTKGSDENTWAFSVEDGYLYYSRTSDSDSNYLPTKTFDVVDKTASWTVEIDSETSAATITNIFNTSRKLQYNKASNSLRFAAYTGKQENPAIYKLVGDTTNLGTDEGTNEEKELFTVNFGSASYDKYVNSYTSSFVATVSGYSWNVTGFNNSKANNPWNHIRTGRDEKAVTGRIDTQNPIAAKITKVVVTISATDEGVNSFKLYVADNADFSGAEVVEMGIAIKDVAFIIPASAQGVNLYYRVEIDCNDTVKSNGYVHVDKVSYWG